MKLQKSSLVITLTAVILVLATTLIGVRHLWQAVISYHASRLSQQITTTLYNDIAQGNYFGVTSALGRMQMANVIENSAVFQIESKEINWVYSSNTEIKAALEKDPEIGRHCAGADPSVTLLGDNKIQFLTALSSPNIGQGSTCLGVVSSIPASLVQLRNLVLATFSLVATIAMMAMAILFARLSRQEISHERKLTAEQMRSAQALSELANQVAHDIRSPLSALGMAINQFEKTTQHESLKLARLAVSRINNIANDLLKNKLHRDPKIDDQASSQTASLIDVGELVDQIVKEKQLQFMNHPTIQLSADVRDNAMPSVHFEATELSRILSNLINNSVESLSGSGKVQVSVRKFKTELGVIVSDNGKGIPATALESLGTKGFSVGKSNHDDAGSGLGLYHAKTSIERAGGRLQIQSKEGIGTIVQLMLPIPLKT